KRYLVIHGDHFDLVVTQARWLALIGGKAYDWAIGANRLFNAVRRRLGFPYWSLSQWLKLKVKNAVNFISEFEKTLVAEARRREVDGVICGHIHHAAIREDIGVRYINCGDWVESCTAIAEHADGRFEIITWTTDVRWPMPATGASDEDEEEIGAAAGGRRLDASSLRHAGAAGRELHSPRGRQRRKAALEIANQVVGVLEPDMEAHRWSARRPPRGGTHADAIERDHQALVAAP